ncbi:hypothetical protein BX600DRAFT_505551 [Xylariales sp. PMI_506]|nr:hypothetical protein BX600DRAFT_505551 [Xylariales sp. PMI_506]
MCGNADAIHSYRGEQDTCSAEATTPVLLNSPPASTVDHREVDSLRSRVFELEAELHRRQSPERPSQRTASSPNLGIENGSDDDTLIRSASHEPRKDDDDTTGQVTGSSDAVIADAASILEFLAWGRRKNANYSLEISLETNESAESLSGDVCDAPPASTLPKISHDTSRIAPLQLLLPSKKQIWELARYHQECLLWHHGSFYTPKFQSQLTDFFDRFNGVVDSRGLNLQWLALLFAVITGSITCAPEHKTQEWGFRQRERETLSRRWFQAVYICLNAAEYAANHSILSIQAISTLTISSHILGFSNVHSIHLAAVIRVAQSLGLHRISDESPGTVVDKECGRRLWSQLCCQDWFSIPFSETYLINPLHSRSGEPMNCHDDEMVSLPDSIPTIVTYTRLLTRIAAIMPRLQDDLMSCNTPYTKYEQIIKWDKRMRAISTSERPVFLLNVPIEPSWPPYVSWARRSLAISSAHKIIMIHRTFLSESFTNPAFSFTRRTCLAASKTIIKEYKHAVEEDGPVFWVHQAFSVAASIILVLDILHRSPDESEYLEHKQLVEDAVGLLRQYQNSMIAVRGVKLLSSLLEEISGHSQIYNTRKRNYDGSPAYASPSTDFKLTGRVFNVSAFVKGFCNGKRQGNGTGTGRTNPDFPDWRSAPVDASLSPTLADTRPLMIGSFDMFSSADIDHDGLFLPPGLETATPFENLLYLANHEFT